MIGLNDSAWAAVRGDDGGDATGKGFKDDVTKGIGVRGEDEEIHVGVGAGEGFAAQDAGEGCGGEDCAEGFFLRAVADDDEMGVNVGFCKLLLDFGEEGDVLFNRETANVTEGEGAVVERAGAVGGGEKSCVYTTLHEMAGFAGGLGEHVAEVLIGGEEDLGEGAEAGGDVERGGFDGGGELLEEGGEAAGGVLVDVGVPGCGQWNVQLMSEVGGEDAQLRRAGEVDEIGLEAVEGIFDELSVTPEEGVEGEVFFDPDGGEGAGEFEELDGICGGFVDFRGAGADAEEGKGTALGEGDEVAGGMGYPVDFMEGIGEVGDARRAHRTTLPCVRGWIWRGAGMVKRSARRGGMHHKRGQDAVWTHGEGCVFIGDLRFAP